MTATSIKAVAAWFGTNSAPATPLPADIPPDETGPPCAAYDATGRKLAPLGVTRTGRPKSRCSKCRASWCWVGRRWRGQETPKRQPPKDQPPPQPDTLVINGTTRTAKCQWCQHRDQRDGRIGCTLGFLGGRTYSIHSKAIRYPPCAAWDAFEWGD